MLAGGRMRPPKCPRCKTSDFVVPVATAQRVGTVGGAIGGGVLYTSSITSALVGFCLSGPGSMATMLAAGMSGGLAAVLAGMVTGAKIGQEVDTNVLKKFFCNRCGGELHG